MLRQQLVHHTTIFINHLLPNHTIKSSSFFLFLVR
jgi:hypothetical protein